MQPAGQREGRLRLAEPLRKLRRAERHGDAEIGLDRRRVHADRLGRALAADAARGRGVEAPLQPLRVELAHPKVDRVRREVGGQRGAERLEALADREAERELLVVARRAHRHRDRLAADADLERLLDRDEVVSEHLPAARDRRRRARYPSGQIRPARHVRHATGDRPCRRAVTKSHRSRSAVVLPAAFALGRACRRFLPTCPQGARAPLHSR